MSGLKRILAEGSKAPKTAFGCSDSSSCIGKPTIESQAVPNGAITPYGVLVSKFDLAMNAWAKVDPLVHEVVKKVIKMRLDFNRSIFAELGFDGDELEMRTRLFVCYHSWEEIMFTDDNDDKNLRLQKLRYKMFIK